jgi:stage V sporulation protein B
MAKETGNSIIKGTMILIGGNIVVKIIGALFKLPLANIIGADGMGLYNASFTVYDIFLVLSTAGYTLAISKMVSSCCAHGKDGEALAILKVTRRLFFVIGFIFSLAMFFGAQIFAGLIGNTRSYRCIIMLAPAVLFVSLMCAYRGYYQGTNDMVPTTISQVVEAIVRLVFGLSISWYLKTQGYSIEIVSAGAIVGITIGEFSSTFTLAMMHRFKRRGKKPRRRCYTAKRSILKTLFATSIPIGISGIIISVINILDNSIVMHRLQQTGCTEQEANTLYGAFNMAFTVFSLPVTTVMAVTTSVFPVLSYAHACHNYNRVTRISQASMRIVMLASTAAGAIFLSLSQPIIMLLYFGQPHDAKIAVPLLVLMAPSAVLISLSVMTGTILQAIDKLLVPSRSAIIGGGICLAFNWFLIGNPRIGIYGVPIGISVCYLITTALNLSAIHKCGIKMDFKGIFLKPLLPAAMLAIIAATTYYVSFPVLGILKAVGLSLALSIVCYLLVLFMTKTVQKDDLLMLPKGKKIVRFLEKIHLLSNPHCETDSFSQKSPVPHNLIIHK